METTSPPWRPKEKVYEKTGRGAPHRNHEADGKDWKGLLKTLSVSIDEPSLKGSNLA